MRRRAFIVTLAGAAAWPVAARAQQTERVRRIAVLVNLSETNPIAQRYISAFRLGLQELGWVDGRNARVDIRWGAGDSAGYRRYAAELVALGPDVILAATTPAVVALKEITRSAPIVFVGSSIQSAPAWSQAWRGRVPTSLALPCLSMQSPRNGWNSLKKSRPG